MPSGRLAMPSTTRPDSMHGKAGNAMVDGDKAQANAAKIADYCKKNANATIASALEALAKM
jgi:acid stress chaperone HdeB